MKLLLSRTTLKLERSLVVAGLTVSTELVPPKNCRENSNSRPHSSLQFKIRDLKQLPQGCPLSTSLEVIRTSERPGATI